MGVVLLLTLLSVFNLSARSLCNISFNTNVILLLLQQNLKSGLRYVYMSADAHLPSADAHLPSADAHLPSADAPLLSADAHFLSADAHLTSADAHLPSAGMF